MTRRALAFALAAALGATGCADNMTSVQIAAICAPPDDAAICTFASTCDAQFIGITAIDTVQTNTLWLIVQVNNQTTNNAEKARITRIPDIRRRSIQRSENQTDESLFFEPLLKLVLLASQEFSYCIETRIVCPNMISVAADRLRSRAVSLICRFSSN